MKRTLCTGALVRTFILCLLPTGHLPASSAPRRRCLSFLPLGPCNCCSSLKCSTQLIAVQVTTQNHLLKEALLDDSNPSPSPLLTLHHILSFLSSQHLTVTEMICFYVYCPSTSSHENVRLLRAGLLSSFFTTTYLVPRTQCPVKSPESFVASLDDEHSGQTCILEKNIDLESFYPFIS